MKEFIMASYFPTVVNFASPYKKFKNQGLKTREAVGFDKKASPDNPRKKNLDHLLR